MRPGNRLTLLSAQCVLQLNSQRGKRTSAILIRSLAWFGGTGTLKPQNPRLSKGRYMEQPMTGEGDGGKGRLSLEHLRVALHLSPQSHLSTPHVASKRAWNGGEGMHLCVRWQETPGWRCLLGGNMGLSIGWGRLQKFGEGIF